MFHCFANDTHFAIFKKMYMYCKKIFASTLSLSLNWHANNNKKFSLPDCVNIAMFCLQCCKYSITKFKSTHDIVALWLSKHKTQQTIGSVERDSGEEGMERLWCGGGGGGVISCADSGEGN